ncbi:PA2169 family four-helix-bundle protein [Rhodohalobacter sp. SW132]|uniref:PA2169 family four-helix-bundle protein n=1 Tax=Rhodohalobacter sp. SW132 TaxID=2293433 RepID=UPI000E244407|nr:PA2169 family four-helix-bundle protein [Rhodohalobacter sp. SW132]REL32893.1 PA2169 family four-helix-bundle protein [Rhodohalobacter sp. SW132]
MKNEKAIEVLHTLVEINSDRIDGYEKASENTEERVLKDLFLTFEHTSEKSLGELNDKILKLGGRVTKGPTTSGKFFRTWIDFKFALTGKDTRAILNSCDYGEENAVEVYNNVLSDKSKYLNHLQQEMIMSQLIQLKADQSTIKSMQNNLTEA